MSPYALRVMLAIRRSQREASIQRRARRVDVKVYSALDILTRKATRDDYRRIAVNWPGQYDNLRIMRVGAWHLA